MGAVYTCQTTQDEILKRWEQTCVVSVQQQSHSFPPLGSNVGQEVKTDYRRSLSTDSLNHKLVIF